MDASTLRAVVQLASLGRTGRLEPSRRVDRLSLPADSTSPVRGPTRAAEGLLVQSSATHSGARPGGGVGKQRAIASWREGSAVGAKEYVRAEWADRRRAAAGDGGGDDGAPTPPPPRAADATRHACIGPSSGLQSNADAAGMQWP